MPNDKEVHFRIPRFCIPPYSIALFLCQVSYNRFSKTTKSLIEEKEIARKLGVQKSNRVVDLTREY